MGTAVSTFRARHWEKNLAAELFDVASLLQYFKGAVAAADFNEKVCPLLRTDPAEVAELIAARATGEILRLEHNFTPREEKGERWTKTRVVRTFEWINRFRGDIWRLVAEILDVARLLGATAVDLQEAGHQSARFNRMDTEDWRIILASGSTSFGQWGGYWDVKLFEKHVRGQSTG